MAVLELLSLLAACFVVPSASQANHDMCYKTANPLGSCSCHQQLFISEDCSQGFLCRDDVHQEDERNDGCLIVCNPGWALVADPRNDGHWFCTNITTPFCPGKFNTGGNSELPDILQTLNKTLHKTANIMGVLRCLYIS